MFSDVPKATQQGNGRTRSDEISRFYLTLQYVMVPPSKIASPNYILSRSLEVNCCCCRHGLSCLVFCFCDVSEHLLRNYYLPGIILSILYVIMCVISKWGYIDGEITSSFSSTLSSTYSPSPPPFFSPFTEGVTKDKVFHKLPRVTSWKRVALGF